MPSFTFEMTQGLAVVGDTIIVEADLFVDGHDVIRGLLRSRHESHDQWMETPLQPVGNDRWRASFDAEISC
ncbi:MAG: DUF3416 domain-containing protein [Nitrospira sp.]|nr:DUF3416 domain-containing protein [Nitrospira sp.]